MRATMHSLSSYPYLLKMIEIVRVYQIPVVGARTPHYEQCVTV